MDGAILLPRGQLPLNVFEPRYLALVDDVLRANRCIGIISRKQIRDRAPGRRSMKSAVSAGSRPFAEAEGGRYLVTLSGVTRFRVVRELTVMTPYRQTQVSYEEFARDRSVETDEASLDRPALLTALRRYFTANRIESDWDSIEKAPAEALVNSLSMIAPVQPAGKTGAPRAPSVADRAVALVALIELALASAPADNPMKPN